MSARERHARAVFTVAVLTTAVFVALGRAGQEGLAAAALTVAAAVWYLAETVAASSRRHAQAVRSLRQIHLYAHSAESAAATRDRAAGPGRDPAPGTILDRDPAPGTILDRERGITRLPRRPR